MIDVLASASVAIAPVLVAHQGGWDEILLIGGPILAIAGLLWVAKKRVDRADRSGAAEGAGTDTDTPDGTPTAP